MVERVDCSWVQNEVCLGDMDLSNMSYGVGNDPREVNYVSEVSFCKRIRGNLYITGAIRTFPLCLVEINGSLVVENNSKLVNFVGLNNLEIITGDLIIKNVSYLSTYHGLNALQTIQGSFHVEGSGKLISKSQLDQLTFAQLDTGNVVYDTERRRYFVNKNESSKQGCLNGDIKPLADENFYFPRRVRTPLLPGQESFFDISPNIQLFTNDSLIPLSTFTGLESLRNIGKDFVISRIPHLESFMGIDNLRIVGGSLVIARNPFLSNLDALEELQTVQGDLIIISNNRLVTLGNLSALEEVLGNFVVVKNRKLVVEQRIIVLENNLTLSVEQTVESLEAALGYVFIKTGRAEIHCPKGSGLKVVDGSLEGTVFDSPTTHLKRRLFDPLYDPLEKESKNLLTSPSKVQGSLESISYGNHCSISCKEGSFLQCLDEDSKGFGSWKTKKGDFWNATWSPYCSKDGSTTKV
eukprot:augustus_masked-scaffold_2-processed-gene-20.53-mRNA-1 protein AED:1.00 eAED:1.00 QI:0/0/0/0/1/1/2/0/465